MEHYLKRIWEILADGAGGRNPGLRQMVLCTRNANAADGRIVILRHVDVRRGLLTYYSDKRAAKIAHYAWPVSAVFWDSPNQMQIRARGAAAVLDDTAVVDGYWEGVGAHARGNYRALLSPGEPVADASACATLAAGSGRDNFVVTRVSVTYLDVLWLQKSRRLQAARGDLKQPWEAHWVQV